MWILCVLCALSCLNDVILCPGISYPAIFMVRRFHVHIIFIPPNKLACVTKCYSLDGATLLRPAEATASTRGQYLASSKAYRFCCCCCADGRHAEWIVESDRRISDESSYSIRQLYVWSQSYIRSLHGIQQHNATARNRRNRAKFSQQVNNTTTAAIAFDFCIIGRFLKSLLVTAILRKKYLKLLLQNFLQIAGHILEIT